MSANAGRTNGAGGARQAAAAPRRRSRLDDAGLWVYVHDHRIVGRVVKAGTVEGAVVAREDDPSDPPTHGPAGPTGATIEEWMRAEIERALVALGRATIELSPAWATYGDIALQPDGKGGLGNGFMSGQARLMGCADGMTIAVSTTAIAFLDDMPGAARETILDNLETLLTMGAGGPRIEVAR